MRFVAVLRITAMRGRFRVVPGASGVARLADLSPAEHTTLIRSLDVLDASSDVVVMDCGAGITRSDWSNRPAFYLYQAFIKTHP